MSSVSPEAAVDRSAYLLFYRRRTDGPLGPEYLQNLIGKATESTTRSSSESGEGQRLGGPSSPSGSSNGSRAAAAAHQLHDPAPGENGGSARVSQARNANLATALDSHDLPPAYEDEGVSMDDPLPSAEDGGSTNTNDGPIYHSAASNWSFANLDRRRASDAGSDDDADNGGAVRKAEPGSFYGLKLNSGPFGRAATGHGPTNSDDETLGQDEMNSDDNLSFGALEGSPLHDRMMQFDGGDDFGGDGDTEMAPSSEHPTTPDRVHYKVGGSGTGTDEEAVHDIRVSSGENSEVE